jgi:hypothetical protein
MILAAPPPICMVAERAAPLLAAAVNATVPEPSPLAPPVIVIHDAVVVAVHVQPLPEVTAIVPLPPLAAMACDGGSSAYVQGAGAGAGFGLGLGGGSGIGVGTSNAGWLIVTGRSATTTLPSRSSPPFGRTLRVTVPFPDPLDPAVTVIQAALLAAVHAHAGELAPTVISIERPAAGLAAADGLTVNWHGAGSCVTSTVASFTVTMPWRGEGSAFAATRYVTVASPWPDPDDVIEIHAVGVDADHVQSRFVLMVMVPEAPAAGTEGIELVTDTEHFSSVGEVTEIDDDPQAVARQASAAHQSRLATTDERCCRAPMRDARMCKRVAHVPADPF